VITPPAPVTVPFGAPVTLEATATDTEEGDISARIEWADLATNHFTPTGGTGASFTFTPDDNGSYLVTLTVTDKDGGSGSASTGPVAGPWNVSFVHRETTQRYSGECW